MIDLPVHYSWHTAPTGLTIRFTHPTVPDGPQLVAGDLDEMTINGVTVRLLVVEATYAGGACTVLAEVLNPAAYEDAVRSDDDVDDIIANHPWDL